MSKHEHVTKAELIEALLKAINEKYAQHTSNCDLRLPVNYEEQYGRPTIVRRCDCGYTQWYLNTQNLLDRANQ